MSSSQGRPHPRTIHSAHSANAGGLYDIPVDPGHDPKTVLLLEGGIKAPAYVSAETIRTKLRDAVAVVQHKEPAECPTPPSTPT